VADTDGKAIQLRGSVWRIDVTSPAHYAVEWTEEHIFKPLEAASQVEPLVLLVVFSPQVKRTAAHTAALWVEAIRSGRIRLRAGLVVNQSMAIRAAANGVGLALQTLGAALAVHSFKALEEAEAWVAKNVP